MSKESIFLLIVTNRGSVHSYFFFFSKKGIAFFFIYIKILNLYSLGE